MIDFTALNNNMKTWIKNVTSLTDADVINQNDNNPRPTGQYATVRIFDPIEIGHDTAKFSDSANNTVDINYSGLRQIMVTVNIYKDGANTALSLMASLKSSLNRINQIQYFNDLNIGIINASATRDLSAVVRDDWEERRQADFFFYIADEGVENFEAILKIKGEGFGIPYEI